MEVIFFLLPIVLFIEVIVVIGFMWALRSGQFDDLDTPAVRALFDEESERKKTGTSKDAKAKKP